MIFLTGSAFQARSQPVSETPWEVVDRGLYFRVWQKTITHTDPETGELKEAHRQYTELGDGMHYREDGQWKESQDLIEIAEVGAVARKGPHQVIFSPNLAAEVAIDHLGHGGTRLQSRVLGLYYFDAASGQSARIASLEDSQGQVLPPNQALYPDAFNGLEADLLYTYTKRGFEQDVILLEEPPLPEELGFDPTTTRLEVWTEFLDPPQPEKRTVVLARERDPERRDQMVEPDLIDEILFFGDLWFPVGTAFRFEAPQPEQPGEAVRIRLRNPANPDVLPVGKQWRVIEGRTVLIESVNYLDLLGLMADFVEGQASIDSSSVKQRVAQKRQLPEIDQPAALEQPLEVAQRQYNPDGVVLDAITLGGSTNSYTFETGKTYHIADPFTVGPNATVFKPGCVLKYDLGSRVVATGSISFPETDQTPVFTVIGDDGYGEDVNQATMYFWAGNPELKIYYPSGATTVQNARFRWALNNLEYVGGATNTLVHTVKDSLFEESDDGIYLDSNSEVDLTDVQKCDLSTPIAGSGTANGSMTDALFCTMTNNFVGLNRVDHPLLTTVPVPDTQGAAGPNHYVEVTNGGVAVFDRDDGALLDTTYLPDLFEENGEAPHATVGDPQLRYDHRSQRWMVTAVDGIGVAEDAVTNAEDVLLAVSDNSDPRLLTNAWSAFRIEIGQPTNGWNSDFAKLGVDKNGIYICAYQFSEDANNNKIPEGNRIAAIYNRRSY